MMTMLQTSKYNISSYLNLLTDTKLMHRNVKL
jgi:hypothetical protein